MAAGRGRGRTVVDEEADRRDLLRLVRRAQVLAGERVDGGRVSVSVVTADAVRLAAMELAEMEPARADDWSVWGEAVGSLLERGAGSGGGES